VQLPKVELRRVKKYKQTRLHNSVTYRRDGTLKTAFIRVRFLMEKKGENKMANKTFEIVRLAIINDQLGNPKELTLKIEENSLSDSDKSRIKQAVLESAAKNTSLMPLELAESLCKAFILIQADTCSKGE
jgi:hypothetical protein